MRRVPRFLSARLSPTLPRSTRPTTSIARPFLSSTRSQPGTIRRQPFHASIARPKGLSPTSEEPEPPKGEEHAGGKRHVAEPATLTTDEYHDIADQYIDALVLKLEEMAEDTSEKLEVEYSAGVLTLNTKQGDYVLNKQPPNKQIWLSSPISGPKRYDWVISGDHHHEKEGTEQGGGEWIYLRDGSRLSDLIKKEIGVEMDDEMQEGREGPGSRGA